MSTTMHLGVALMIMAGCGQQGAAPREDPSAEEDLRQPDELDGSSSSKRSSNETELLRLSTKAVERSGIRIAEVELDHLSNEVEAPAEIQLPHESVAHISPLVSGRLGDVRVHRGDPVKAGQVLAVMSSVELGEARARLAKAQALMEVAKSGFDRQKRLRDEGIAAERAVIEAQAKQREAQAERDAAKAYLAVFRAGGGIGPDMPLKSPIDGRVIEVHAVRGETVGPDSKLFIVANLSKVIAVGKVYEQDLANIKVGMEAKLTLRAYPDRVFEGEVTFVPCALDTETRSLDVRVELDNSEGILRRGLFGTLKLIGARGEDAGLGRQVPVISEEAVQSIGDRALAFVPTAEKGVFRPVTVTVGAASGGRVEILSGLARGDRVVVEGAFVLKSHLLRGELEEK